MSRWPYLSVLVLSLACRNASPPPAPPPEPVPPKAAAHDAPADPPSTAVAAPTTIKPLAVCQAGELDALSAARKYYDEEKFDDALACAAQATALDPGNPQAHSEHGAALAALDQLDAAQLAYARALALEPDHLDALLGAAHLFGVRMASSRERDELASVYAERGLELAEQQDDQELVVEFALISAMTFNDLGQAKDALDRADKVLAHKKGHRGALYEKAVALFELCRFPEAKQAFLALENDPEHAAHAHHHLGLILEREGKWKQAEAHFAQAQKLAPEDFGPPQLLSAADFQKEIDKAVAELPADMRHDLEGIPVKAEELPKSDDLLSGDPPLSPAILGLYRGPPLDSACDGSETPCRSVALYRRNLGRAVKTQAELLEQIRVTLLHEVGHLRGEDDFELAARGLE